MNSCFSIDRDTKIAVSPSTSWNQKIMVVLTVATKCEVYCCFDVQYCPLATSQIHAWQGMAIFNAWQVQHYVNNTAAGLPT